MMDNSSNYNPIALGKELDIIPGGFACGASIERALALSNEGCLFSGWKNMSVEEIVATQVMVVHSDYVRNPFDDHSKANLELFTKLPEAILNQPYRYVVPCRVFVVDRDTEALLEKSLQARVSRSESCTLGVMRPDICNGSVKERGPTLAERF